MNGNLWVDGKLFESNVEFAIKPGQSKSDEVQFLGGGKEQVPTLKEPDHVFFRTTLSLATMNKNYEMEVEGKKIKIMLERRNGNNFQGTISL